MQKAHLKGLNMQNLLIQGLREISNGKEDARFPLGFEKIKVATQFLNIGYPVSFQPYRILETVDFPGNYISQWREVAPTGSESFVGEKQKFPTQENAIIEVLHVGKQEAYHARDVQSALSKILGVKMLLTSVRRALSNLHKAGKVKGDKIKLDATTKKNVRAYYIPRKPEIGQIQLF